MEAEFKNMKQKLVEETVAYLRSLPKEDRMVVLMDIELNISSNIGLSRIEVAGVYHCIQTEMDKEFLSGEETEGVSFSLDGNEN